MTLYPYSSYNKCALFHLILFTSQIHSFIKHFTVPCQNVTFTRSLNSAEENVRMCQENLHLGELQCLGKFSSEYAPVYGECCKSWALNKDSQHHAVTFLHKSNEWMWHIKPIAQFSLFWTQNMRREDRELKTFIFYMKSYEEIYQCLTDEKVINCFVC